MRTKAERAKGMEKYTVVIFLYIKKRTTAKKISSIFLTQSLCALILCGCVKYSTFAPRSQRILHGTIYSSDRPHLSETQTDPFGILLPQSILMLRSCVQRMGVFCLWHLSYFPFVKHTLPLWASLSNGFETILGTKGFSGMIWVQSKVVIRFFALILAVNGWKYYSWPTHIFHPDISHSQFFSHFFHQTNILHWVQ